MRPKVFIATPTMRRTVHSDFMMSLMALTTQMMRSGIHTQLAMQDGAAITMQRDILAYRFLEESDATHMLLIDSDMTFPPSICETLLAFDKELVGALYPLRSFSFERMKRSLEAGASFDDARASGYDFYGPLESVQKQDGLYQIQAIPTGMMLIRRSAFERIVAHAPPERYKCLYYGSKIMWRFFGEAISAENELQTEDVSFCHRFTRAGGKVWAYPSAVIGHVGTFTYQMSYDQWSKATTDNPRS